jgi:hypothetical protein
MRPLLKYCLIVQFVLVVFFQMVCWFRLGSLNAQHNFIPVYELITERKLTFGDILILRLFTIPVFIFFIGYKKNKYPIMVLPMVFYLVWLILQLKTWWIAYIFGASDKWIEVYNRTFSTTHKILPANGKHLPPDTMHLVIQILLIVIIFLFIKSSLKFRSRKLIAHAV